MTWAMQSVLYGPTLSAGRHLAAALDEVVLRTATALARPDRELWVSGSGPEFARIRVRKHLGTGGGLRVAGYAHVRRTRGGWRVDVSGWQAEALAKGLEVVS
jgi:hypothetical protein